MNAAENIIDAGVVAPDGAPEGNRPKYTSPGRRGLRRLEIEGARFVHFVKPIDDSCLTRRYRRIVAAILRRVAMRGDVLPTDPKKLARRPEARELARALGDVVAMLPLAVDVLKSGVELRELPAKDQALIRSVMVAAPYASGGKAGRRMRINARKAAAKEAAREVQP